MLSMVLFSIRFQIDSNFIKTNILDFLFQYYLDVVSTKVRTRWLRSDTFQFSVSELSRALDHSSGSHGMPGIFFKYDFSPVCVIINEHTLSFGKFLLRLCAIVGGIFATSCIVNGLINFFHNFFFEFISNHKKKSPNNQLIKNQSNGGSSDLNKLQT